MARPLMFQAEPWLPVEITMRCMQGRLLLRPGSESNRRILGVLGRAMELYAGRVELYFAGGTSNHLHIIAAFDSSESKALWKSHVKTNISKELGELYDWAGSHWDRRTRDIYILDDSAPGVGETRIDCLIGDTALDLNDADLDDNLVCYFVTGE